MEDYQKAGVPLIWVINPKSRTVRVHRCDDSISYLREDEELSGEDVIPGFRCPLPTGAFYAFVNVEGTGIGSKELADYLLNEAGVACLNGGAFGAHGDGYIRFSYANSLENILDAVERIRKVSSRWAARV